MKTDLFQSCGHCWVFQICWHIECSTFRASSFRIWNSSTGIPSPPLALFVVMLSKAHLTSHSRMSGSRWVITPSRLSWSWRNYARRKFKNIHGFPGKWDGKESACRRHQFNSWVRKIPWRRNRLPTPEFLGFPGSSVDKETTCSVGDLGLIPELGRFSRGEHGYPLQYSCLEYSHEQRILVGYISWGHKESDMTERLSTFIYVERFWLINCKFYS